jgi:quinol-cytochrome oxidoreductase complex cytochrome b subunit
MNPLWSDRLTAASARLGMMLLGVVLVQAITGVLLSMWYVPSRNAAVMPDGRAASISTGQRIENVGTFIDTLGVNGRPTLVPARTGDVVPSQAAASVAVSITNAPAGEVIRRIHHHTTGWLYTLSILLLVILGVLTTFRTNGATWIRVVTAVILVVVGAWSGRLLPDDVYAEISRRIVGHELQEAPFGGLFATLFGVDPQSPLLSRTFVMHAIIGAALLTTFWKPLSAMRGAASVASGVSQDPVGGPLQRALMIAAGAFAVMLGTAVNPIVDSPVRDVVGGLHGEVSAEPWWVIRPLHTLVEWFGAELAGYLLITLVLALLVLPLRRRNSVPE